MKRKKILFLINTLTGGGAEKVLVDLVNNLDKAKYEITVQTILDVGIHKKSLDKHVNYKTIVKNKNKFISKLLCYIFSFILSPKIVYNLFVKSDYDYEVAFLEGVPTKIISASTNKYSLKYAWVHTDLYNNFSGHEKIFKKIDDYIECYKRFNKIICVSESVKKAFTQRFSITENLFVKYNILDDKKITEKSKESITDVPKNAKFKIITVGRLCKQKGFDRLLKVYKDINKQFENKTELWILGEGEEKENLLKLVRNYNLNSVVRFFGYKENPYKYIKNADLFVCSSRAEGFSLVVVEALILGIPVLSTNCSGPDEILDKSQYGLLVENNNQGIYNGIHRFLSDSMCYSYYKEKANERGWDFHMDKNLNEIEKLFFNQ